MDGHFPALRGRYSIKGTAGVERNSEIRSILFSRMTGPVFAGPSESIQSELIAPDGPIFQWSGSILDLPIPAFQFYGLCQF